jgi:hypothetical protein
VHVVPVLVQLVQKYDVGLFVQLTLSVSGVPTASVVPDAVSVQFGVPPDGGGGAGGVGSTAQNTTGRGPLPVPSIV